MREKRLFGFVLAMLLVAMLGGLASQNVLAERYTSPNYTIDASVLGNSFGGTTTSANYQLTSAGGESVVGQGSGGSYKLDAGYVAQLAEQDATFTMSLQPTGLIGYYSFDEYKDNQMTIANDAGVTSRAINVNLSAYQPVSGKLGQAISSGGNSYAYDDSEGGQGYYVVPPGGVLTATGWFNTSTPAGTDYKPLLWNEYSCVGWYVAVETDSLLGVSYTGGTGCGNVTGYYNVYSDNTIVDGSWHYFAAVIDRSAGVLKLYIDGVLNDQTTNIDTSSVNVLTNRLRLTSDWNAGNIYTGLLDEVKLFSRVLSDDEISAEYSSQNAGIGSGVALGTLTPNASNATLVDAIVDTNTESYSLAISQDKNLTSQMSTIPAISSTITSPSAWAEGSTKGLGFSLVSANAQAIDTKWNAGSSYAAIPGTATTVYNRSGNQHPAKDTLTMRLRADVAASQPMGAYSNVVTMTGTYLP